MKTEIKSEAVKLVAKFRYEIACNCISYKSAIKASEQAALLHCQLMIEEFKNELIDEINEDEVPLINNRILYYQSLIEEIQII